MHNKQDAGFWMLRMRIRSSRTIISMKDESR
jgi:hypothetical protein